MMDKKIIYRLSHEHDKYVEYEFKLLGYYSNLEKLKEAVLRYKKLEGFKENPIDYFKMRLVIVDEDNDYINGFEAYEEQKNGRSFESEQFLTDALKQFENDHINGNELKLFALDFLYEFGEQYEYNDFYHLGVYSSVDQIKYAIERYRSLKGFKSLSEECFEFHEIEIDKDSEWLEGYFKQNWNEY